MNDKNVAKKYLIMTSALFVVLFLITTGLLFALERISWGQISLISLACAYLPCASFTGFCICFMPIKEFTKAMKIALIFFFPIALAGITLIGIVMLVPTYIKELIILKKGT